MEIQRADLEESHGDATNTTGRATLQALVQNNMKEYQALTEEEKAGIIEEFTQNRLEEAKGIRKTARSRVDDVTYTVSAIENEL
jgi:hypothetical protein